ncbi:16S rRNA methyltransferase [Caloranaerobacter sp. TR13]|uniref:16S rRNA (guanine(527)-N(7))-methyltransferase RsmG n=1 Tax=Caloranaerobacter sp. TR13 TaxID=1302151 RepID=UPI0006D3FA45|nr:16S rRNA (guanine(527)-N(7))-methyltransferase RsmG [Caloranaerobacter sp. TR13]KPU26446.1 16S rRNA methyltransferase [Caloranaerobacter sp. TR13]
MSNVDTLIEGSRELGISLKKEEIDKFLKFKELLKEWNKKINLTAIEDDKEIDIKHFLDSLTLLKTDYIKDNYRIIDIGTGGGFPGIPLKIVKNDVELVLMDSLQKRIKFLDLVINELGLSNIKAIHGRAEDFGRDVEYREKFDIAVSRAVASLNILSEYCLPFVKVGGYFIAMKGPDVDIELKESEKALKLLGGKVLDKIQIKLPLSDITHTLIIIEKINKTLTKYPRKAGKPKKNPL